MSAPPRVSRSAVVPAALFALVLCAVVMVPPAPAADPARAPMAVAAGSGRVFVADLDGDRIDVLASDGVIAASWGVSGTAPGELSGPAGLAVDRDGSLWVAELFNRRIQHFTADGRLLGGFPLGDDAAPLGLALDARGRLVVTDVDAGQVRVWSRDGALRASFGARGSRAGELLDPWGVVVDAGGDLWVADHGNHRIQQFTGDGEWLAAWGEAGVGEDQLLGPMGLAFDRRGALVVSDLSGRVRSFTRAGSRVARWATGSAAPAVALDADGALWLADPSRARIERLAPALPEAAGTEPPAAFALAPIAQPLGHGPVTLELAIPGPGTVAAEFFSIDGRRVHAVTAAASAGVLRLAWDARGADGREVPAGMYFVRVHFEDGVHRETRAGRVVVLR